MGDEADLARFFDGVGAFDHLVFTAGDWGARTGGPLTALDLTAATATFKIRFLGVPGGDQAWTSQDRGRRLDHPDRRPAGASAE